jgi:hypothetical protein
MFFYKKKKITLASKPGFFILKIRDMKNVILSAKVIAAVVKIPPLPDSIHIFHKMKPGKYRAFFLPPYLNNI